MMVDIAVSVCVDVMVSGCIIPYVARCAQLHGIAHAHRGAGFPAGGAVGMRPAVTRPADPACATAAAVLAAASDSPEGI